jgi:hypothetical protein
MKRHLFHRGAVNYRRLKSVSRRKDSIAERRTQGVVGRKPVHQSNDSLLCHYLTTCRSELYNSGP